MKKIIPFLSIVLMLLFISCDSDDNIDNSENQNSIDVYVSGSMNGNACYYKNDELVLLDNNGLSSTYASKIFVNNNIYTFGGGYDGPQQQSTFSNLLWTNGIVTDLNVAYSDSDFELFLISDFYVYNDDVYFVGYLRNISNPSQIDMVYWKNGVKTTIIQNTTYDGNSPSLIVSNDDVYVYLKNANNEYEIFINNIFYPISQNYGAVRMATKNSEVYIFGQILSSSDGFYYNINTGVETITPFFVNRLVVDNDDIYTLALYSGGSFLEKILKNNNLYYQTPAEFIVDDFFVIDNTLYSIERNLDNGPQIVFANNLPIVTLNNPTSYSDSFLGDIYVVQN
ncbi:hypothetical protein [Hanstruepera ponticola]|uniref:hypothetical protein n=1 Tax=Hanstruepera ponticola TaxID=2042995 RepID=UPI0013C4D269|nr:hypothetical protein [Hanstruepera ponticola]